MKNALFILFFCASASVAQFSSTAYHIAPGASLPATCQPGNGDVWFKTSATVGMYQCLTANTWTAVGGGGGAGTPGTPVNSVQFNNPLGTFAGSSDLTFNGIVLSAGSTVIAPSAAATPSAPVAVKSGATGSISYSYTLAYWNGVGYGPQSAATTIANGVDPLTSSNKFTITLPTNNYTCVVIRSASAAATGASSETGIVVFHACDGSAVTDIGQYPSVGPPDGSVGTSAFSAGMYAPMVASLFQGPSQNGPVIGHTVTNASRILVASDGDFTSVRPGDGVIIGAYPAIWACSVFSVEDATHLTCFDPVGDGTTQPMQVQRALLATVAWFDDDHPTAVSRAYNHNDDDWIRLIAESVSGSAPPTHYIGDAGHYNWMAFAQLDLTSPATDPIYTYKGYIDFHTDATAGCLSFLTVAGHVCSDWTSMGSGNILNVDYTNRKVGVKALGIVDLANATDSLPVCRHTDGTLYNGTNTMGVLACP